KRNEADLDDLPEELRQEMTFVLAETLDDVLAAAMPAGFAARRAMIGMTESGIAPRPTVPEQVVAIAWAAGTLTRSGRGPADRRPRVRFVFSRNVSVLPPVFW